MVAPRLAFSVSFVQLHRIIRIKMTSLPKNASVPDPKGYIPGAPGTELRSTFHVKVYLLAPHVRQKGEEEAD